MRLINKLGLMVAVIVAATFMATRAEAAAFTIDFCPEDDTCPDGVTEASLTFDEILTGTDPNDYNVTATIVGDLTQSGVHRRTIVRDRRRSDTQRLRRGCRR